MKQLMKLAPFALLALTAPAMAQAIPKHGTCPSGFMGSGDFCQPLHPDEHAIVKHGTCPSGTFTSGDACKAFPDADPVVARRPGQTCPGSSHASGSGCVGTP